MKQNIDILETPAGRGKILSRHVQVLIGRWTVTPDSSPGMFSPVRRNANWDRWQLLYTLDGKGMLTWQGGQLEMFPGTAVLLAANTEYTFSTDPTSRHWDQYSMVFLPRAYWYDWLRWPEVAPGIMSLKIPSDAREEIKKTLRTACDIAAVPRSHWEDFAMATAELVLLEFQKFNKRPKKKKTGHADSRLQQAIEFMEQNCSSGITCKEIARAAEISQSYLNVLFQKHLSTTPLHYLNTLRINKAQRLLRETTEPISQIGRLCGFPNPISFGYRFRKITGHSPSTYRKALK